MNSYEDNKEMERKLSKEAKEISQDIKENVVGIAHNVRSLSNNKVNVATDYILDGMKNLRLSGTDALEKAEHRIRSKPVQSMAIAFSVGLLARYFIGRKRA